MSLLTGVFSRDRNKHLAFLDKTLREHIRAEIQKISQSLGEKVEENATKVDRLASEVARTRARTDGEIQELKQQLDALCVASRGPRACRNIDRLPRARDFRASTALGNDVFLILKSLATKKTLRFCRDRTVSAEGAFGQRARFFVATLPNGNVKLRNLWFGTWLAMDSEGRVSVSVDEKDAATELRVIRNINGTVSLCVPAAPGSDAAPAAVAPERLAAPAPLAAGATAGAEPGAKPLEHQWFLCVEKSGAVFTKKDVDFRDIAAMFVPMTTKQVPQAQAAQGAPMAAASDHGAPPAEPAAEGKPEGGASADGLAGGLLEKLQQKWARRQEQGQIANKAPRHGRRALLGRPRSPRHPAGPDVATTQAAQDEAAVDKEDEDALAVPQPPQLPGEQRRAFCYNNGLSPRPVLVVGRRVLWDVWIAACNGPPQVLQDASVFQTAGADALLPYFCVKEEAVYFYDTEEMWFRCTTATIVPADL